MMASLSGRCPYCGELHKIELSTDGADGGDILQLTESTNGSGDAIVGDAAVGEMVRAGVFPCSQRPAPPAQHRPSGTIYI